MLPIAEDALDLALLAERPILPMPKLGPSPAVNALEKRMSGHGYVVGSDGIYLILNRPWLRLRAPIGAALFDAEPFGVAGPPALDLAFGKFPAELARQACEHFKQAMPNEAGGFIIWNEQRNTLRYLRATVVEASPERLVYTPPIVDRGDHIVADLHSHGNAPPFWSTTDDEDDRHYTRLSIVFGKFQFARPRFVARLAAGGRFFPIFQNPFEIDQDGATFQPPELR